MVGPALCSEQFWQFSLSVYKRSQVKVVLNELHDHYGVNLNIVLFCCWFACSGQGQLDRNDLIRANELVFTWHDSITERLRNLRKTVADQTCEIEFHGIPEAILKEEIWAEKEEQFRLANAIFSPQSQALKPSETQGIALTNLDAYLDILMVPKTESRQTKLQQLCDAIFSDSRQTDQTAYA